MSSQIAKYIAIGRISFAEHLAYRANVLMEMLGKLFQAVFAVGLWYALYAGTGADVIGGYTYSEMVVYLLGVAVVMGVLHVNHQGDKAMFDINSGRFSNYLLKPISPTLYWFTHDIARKIMMTGVMSIVTLVMWLAISQVVPVEISASGVLWFSAALVLSMVLHFVLFNAVVMLTFWLGLSWGITFVVRVFMLLAVGTYMPLEMYPGWVRAVFEVLPLKHFGYTHMQLLLGRVSGTEAGFTLLHMTVWIVVCALISTIIYRVGVRRYGAYGG